MTRHSICGADSPRQTEKRHTLVLKESKKWHTNNAC